MNDKLDFTGFEPNDTQVPPPPRTRSGSGPKTGNPNSRRKPRPSGRRKKRVNVSLEPNVSAIALETAKHRGMTLSDLLRSAYRDKLNDLDPSWFGESPAPFSHTSPSVTGRVVHMLYLTPQEVEILDDLASRFESSRSGVVGALLHR